MCLKTWEMGRFSACSSFYHRLPCTVLNLPVTYSIRLANQTTYVLSLDKTSTENEVKLVLWPHSISATEKWVVKGF